MSDLQQYVPIQGAAITNDTPTDNTQQPSKEKVQALLFGGDQLTATRAQGCQELRMNSDTDVGRVKGLIPTTEDWHTAVTLLVVSMFVYVVNSVILTHHVQCHVIIAVYADCEDLPLASPCCTHNLNTLCTHKINTMSL